MTRINVVEPTELHPKHLMAEIREITRVYGLVRKAQVKGEPVSVPTEYRLGTGHVKFFYDKLEYVTDRYYRLCSEAMRRGFNISPIPESNLCKGLNRCWFNDYKPTEQAIEMNRRRIKDRLNDMEEKRVRKRRNI